MKKGVKQDKKIILKGTLRVRAKDLKTLSWNGKSWVVSKEKFPNLVQCVEFFKSHKNFDVLIDKKNPYFLKGQYHKGIVQGARVNVLPNGEKLDKAYSLFAKDLIFHDEDSKGHWDVMFRNPNGKFAYVYTLDKKKISSDKKYKRVKDFEKLYDSLIKNVEKGLKKKDFSALVLMTLLKTKMRVGNEIYYRAHGHKGLSTLKKKDLKLKGGQVIFEFKGKDGVPQIICKEFSKSYINFFEEKLKNIKKDDFVFSYRGKLLKEDFYKKAFKKYCGKEFYPHIVRSFYATKKVEDFLKENKKPEKKEIKELFLNIADDLGHKKFSKKKGDWEDSYTVTVNHYINPKLVEKAKKVLNQK